MSRPASVPASAPAVSVPARPIPSVPQFFPEQNYYSLEQAAINDDLDVLASHMSSLLVHLNSVATINGSNSIRSFLTALQPTLQDLAIRMGAVAQQQQYGSFPTREYKEIKDGASVPASYYPSGPAASIPYYPSGPTVSIAPIPSMMAPPSWRAPYTVPASVMHSYAISRAAEYKGSVPYYSSGPAASVPYYPASIPYYPSGPAYYSVHPASVPYTVPASVPYTVPASVPYTVPASVPYTVPASVMHSYAISRAAEYKGSVP
jgi:hypothetical protein